VARRPAALVSDESALEACIRDDALYKLMIFTFFKLKIPPKNKWVANFSQSNMLIMAVNINFYKPSLELLPRLHCRNYQCHTANVKWHIISTVLKEVNGKLCVISKYCTY